LVNPLWHWEEEEQAQIESTNALYQQVMLKALMQGMLNSIRKNSAQKNQSLGGVPLA
jgi:hypothetical protein